MNSSDKHLSHPKYRPDIDGLRAIAVLAVVGFHAFPNWVRGGFIGVDIFFVISGYLISTIIFQSLDKGTFSFREFYARRIKRIFPALITVLIACLGVGYFLLLSDELNQLGKHVAAGAGFISNLVLWSEAGYFDTSAETKPLLHLWSLGIEEQFYIVWPFLIWCVWKKGFNLLTVTLIVAGVSFFLNMKGIKSDPVGTFYSPLTRFWELLLGTSLAWFLLYKPKIFAFLANKLNGALSRMIYKDSAQHHSNLYVNCISLLGFVILIYGFWRIHKELSFPGKWALIPVTGAMLIILAGSGAWLNRVLLSNRVAVWFGLISFPLYLWHWPILSFGQIVSNGTPSREFRILAVLVSFFMAWFTVRVIERPIRFGKAKSKLKVTLLCISLMVVGLTGLLITKLDFAHTHGYEQVVITRPGFEHAFGSSMTWYRGKDDWLFLGNEYDSEVAKLKLAGYPSKIEIDRVVSQFTKLSEVAGTYNTKVALILGPNKSTIYPEYLPEQLIPSKVRYSSFFLDALKTIPNITVYDPTEDLLSAKESEGTLYYRTDTHWNNKGAFVVFKGFTELYNLPAPQVTFSLSSPQEGDLIGISKLKNFPLHPGDNWTINWKQSLDWSTVNIPNEPTTPFGPSSVVINNKASVDKYIWVVGDSYTIALRNYLNATFKKVRYVGHWAHKMDVLSEELFATSDKPDVILIVRVERSF